MYRVAWKLLKNSGEKTVDFQGLQRRLREDDEKLIWLWRSWEKDGRGDSGKDAESDPSEKRNCFTVLQADGAVLHTAR